MHRRSNKNTKFYQHKTVNFFKLLIHFLSNYNFIIAVVLISISSILISDQIPLYWKIVAFTASTLSKEILMFIIPFLVFPLIVYSVIIIPKKAIYFVTALFLLVFISNFLSMFIAYAAGINLVDGISFAKNIKYYQVVEVIFPLIEFHLCIIDIPVMLIFGFIIGAFLRYVHPPNYIKVAEYYYQFSRITLEKVGMFFLPIYITGSILKTTHEIDYVAVLPIFANLILIIFLVQTVYITTLFLIGSQGNIFECIKVIKNIIPACTLGLSTMSSIVVLPVTLKIVEKNTDNCPMAKLMIITTVNCHDIGDCISLPLIALVIIYFTAGYTPDIGNYFLFSFFAALTQFSAVSIPGGSIMVMMPILTKYLGFTEEMLSIMTAIAICIEPLGTAMNIAGNNAIAIIISKIYGNNSKYGNISIL